MECDKIRKDLQAYLEGLSTPEEKSAMEKHLATCAECSAALEDLKKTVHLLRHLDEMEPPAWLTQKVMTRIREETALKESFLTRLFHLFPSGIPAAAVATLVIAVTAVVIIKSMEPKLQETILPSVVEQPLTPAPEISPAPQTSPAPEISPGPIERHKGNEDVVKGRIPSDARVTGKKMDASPEKKEVIQQGPAPESIAAGRENRTSAPRREAVAPPAVPPAPKPAGAISEFGAARDKVLLKDSKNSHGAGYGRPLAGAGEKKPLSETYRQVVTEQHANGRPHIVVTYRTTADESQRTMEERFDDQGRRHGIQTAYDDNGRIMAEVRYEHGEIASIKEYNADGSANSAKSKQDWPWLKHDLQ